MAKLFGGVNRYLLFIKVLALLVSVCFTFPLLQLSEKPQRLLRRSSEGNAVSNRKKVQVYVNLNVVCTFRSGVR